MAKNHKNELKFILPAYRFKNAQFVHKLSCRIPKEFDLKNIGPPEKISIMEISNTTVAPKSRW